MDEERRTSANLKACIAAAAARVARLDLEFHDGHLGAVPEGGPGEATGTEVQVPGANHAS